MISVLSLRCVRGGKADEFERLKNYLTIMVTSRSRKDFHKWSRLTTFESRAQDAVERSRVRTRLQEKEDYPSRFANR